MNKEVAKKEYDKTRAQLLCARQMERLLGLNDPNMKSLVERADVPFDELRNMLDKITSRAKAEFGQAAVVMEDYKDEEPSTR